MEDVDVDRRDVVVRSGTGDMDARTDPGSPTDAP
jgi:hypothetical protein